MASQTRSDISHGNILYWRLRPQWIDFLNLKEPIPTTLPQYLKRYAKEDEDEFLERVKRIAQVNVLDIIVDTYCSMLFATDVRITAAKHQDKVDRFVNKCNRQGDTLKEYFREMVAPAAFTFGSTDVFVDLPKVSGTVQTQAQQNQQGLNDPYCYLVQVLNRVAWDLSESREYTMYRSEDVINKQIGSGTMGVNDEKQYSEWTLDKVTLYNQDGAPLDERPNPFGFIPAVTVIPLPSMRFYDDRVGLSLVQDVMPLQKLILNLISLILDFHESVNFGMRVLKQDTTMGDEPPTEGELGEGGNKRGIIVRGKDSDFKIVTPDPRGVEVMCSFLQEVIERAFQSVRIPSDANTNKTHQSRNTIRGNLAPLYNRLVRISKHFEKSMRQVIEMALRIQGIDPQEAGVNVQWGTNFAFEAFISAIEELTSLRNCMDDIAPTAVAEIARKTVNSQIYDADVSNAVEKEIQEWIKRQDDLNTAPVPVVNSKGQKGQQPAPGEGQKFPTLQKQNTEVNAAEKIIDVGGGN